MTAPSTRRNPIDQHFTGGGEMGARIRSMDWSSTPLGPIDGWPQSLLSAVSILLPSKAQIALFWGPDLVTLYNDAYRPVFGGKHPHALGQPIREAWSELWRAGLKELFQNVLATGDAFWAMDRPFYMERHGFLEETFFDVSYDPVRDESGDVGGVFCIVSETTARVVNERRLGLLRDFSAVAAQALSIVDVLALSKDVLASAPLDIPFTDIDLEGRTKWPLGLHYVASITDHMETAAGPWPEPATKVMVLPLTEGARERGGKIALGVSSRLPFDDSYRDFLKLVASQLTSSIAAAHATETERRRAEALIEIDRAKTAFFSNVSHEFRTPLTLMLGPLEDTLARADLSSDDREQLETVQRNSLRLLKLVNTLLDFSRIEAGRVQAVYEPSDLASVTTELASVFRSAIEKAGLELVVDCAPLSEDAYVDREMWEKIVLNLVSNAFKFTFEGEIEVRLRERFGQIELSVRDTGTGIPADELPRLFERFHRAVGAQGRTYEGSGIGLALVQELAKLHGGSVAVESALGEGSTFVVKIPLGHRHLPADQIGATRTQASTALGATPFVEEALRWLPSGIAQNEADALVRDLDVTEQRDAGTEPRCRVLLADDNADICDYVHRLLASRYDVEVVGDGKAALAAVARNKPDLVLSDIMMPHLDGMGLLSALRADPQTSTVPVILLSARAGEESRVEGLSAGADDYLIKPFSARELRARVEAHLKMARYRAEATETIRANEERFRALVTASFNVVYRMSADWREMRYLDGKEFIADTSNPSEIWLAKYIHPDDQSEVMAAINHAIETKSAFELEHQIIRLDGTLGWAHSRAVPMFDADGEIVEWFGAARDVTSRRQAQETQALLIGELGHRIRNTLAGVQAIAQQSLRKSTNPEAFVESFGGRIQSLARVHALLTGSTWQGADLRDLIDDQLMRGTADQARLVISGSPVQLEAQSALHLALVLHELGTNAFKYGALSLPSGWVNIHWTLDGETLRLRWQEHGGPAITSTERKGFGTTLIEQSIRSEGGTARKSIGPDGLVWEFVLPMARRAESVNPFEEPAVSSDMGLGLASPAMRDPDRRLADRRFLVVEDEPLIGLEIVAGLKEAGAEVVAFVGSVEEALGVLNTTEIDAALLDGNLKGQPVDEIAAALAGRCVPFLFVTGYERDSLPEKFRDAQVLSKPFNQQQLVDSAARLVTARDDSNNSSRRPGPQ